MLKPLLLFRIKQLLRVLDSLGIGYLILFLPLLVFPFLFLKKYTPEYPWHIASGALAIALAIHLKRKDKRFLALLTNKPNPLFYLEYLIIALPPLVALALFNKWLQILAFMVLLLLVPKIKGPAAKSALFEKIICIFPLKLFELRAGLRTSFIPVVLLHFSAAIFSFLPYLSLFLVWNLTLFIASVAFGQNEPLNVLQASELPAKSFLYKKFIIYTNFLLVALLPVIIPYLFFNPGHWLFCALLFLSSSLLLAYTIILKYSFYQPLENSHAFQTYFSIGAIGLFIPFLLPLPFIIGIRHYFRAKSNLNNYLHDFN
jgi:hypothetical protein